jgi:hypothetical protein
MVSRLTNILTFAAGVGEHREQYNERQQRIQDLTTIQDGFIQRFYPPTIYFYCEKTEFYYDGVKYFPQRRRHTALNSFEYKQIPDKPVTGKPK